MTKIELGSKTAKAGFQKEKDVVATFNNWQKELIAQQWLVVMDYVLDEIESVEAFLVHGEKADVHVQVRIKLKKLLDVENLQVKLINNKRGFNQIDKRWVDKYVSLWEMPEQIAILLKKYTGEILPSNPTKDKRRMNANEFKPEELTSILQWLQENKTLIVSDILKGRGKFAAEWMLVISKSIADSAWVLKPINYCINFYGNEDITVSSRGVFKIGKITMQRKGGDGGRHTANMLQFKIDPGLLFMAS